MGHGLSILAILQALLSERALGHEELLFERGLTARLADDRSGCLTGPEETPRNEAQGSDNSHRDQRRSHPAATRGSRGGRRRGGRRRGAAAGPGARRRLARKRRRFSFRLILARVC